MGHAEQTDEPSTPATPKADGLDSPVAHGGSATAPEPREKHFRTEHLVDDLRGRSVRGGAHTVLGQMASFVLQLGSTAVLARLLVPQDFGLIAMVMAVTGFVQMFKDLGLSVATVQRAEINHEQISTLFWVNMALSGALMLLTAVLAPMIAWFYGEPRLIGITLALSTTFLLGGLTVQHQALLRRQMRFGTLALIAIGSQAVAVAVGITSATLGAGYWALVIMIASNSAANAAFVWIACRWRPGLPVRGSGVRTMLAFGGQLSVAQFLGYVRRNIDKVLLGATAGAGPLGLYAKSYQLLLLPINQINRPMRRVALPALSRLQHDPERYRRFYSKAIGLLVTCGMPLVVFAFVDVEKVVLTVLGDQWHASIRIFQFLTPMAFIGTFNIAGGWVNLSLGRGDRNLRANMMSTSVLLIAILSGLSNGPLGVAAAISLAGVLSRGPILAYQLHGSHVSMRDVGGAMWRPAAASILAGVLLYASRSLLDSMNWPLVELVTGAACYGVFYLLAWSILPGGRAILWETLGLLKELRGQRRSKSDPAVQPSATQAL